MNGDSRRSRLTLDDRNEYPPSLPGTNFMDPTQRMAQQYANALSTEQAMLFSAHEVKSTDPLMMLRSKASFVAKAKRQSGNRDRARPSSLGLVDIQAESLRPA
jgi:hypothetical protein